MVDLEKLITQVQLLNLEERNKEVVDLLSDSLLESLQIPELYLLKGKALSKLKKSEYKKIYSKAIELEPKNPNLYYEYGYTLDNNEENEEAIQQYLKAIRYGLKTINCFYFLAHTYKDLQAYDKAIKVIKRAIYLAPNDIYNHSSLGMFLHSQKKYDEAIVALKEAIRLDSNFPYAYYHLGNSYFELKQYIHAKENYEKFIELSKDKSDYTYKYSKSRLVEIKKLLADADYRSISGLVSNIKDLLLYSGSCVTHYTSLSAAKALVIENSKFRLSEGAFLNDTSEGRVLFNFLPFKAPSKSNDNTVATLFAAKPFIGSFVNDVKHDDLTLWRMYGKEAKEEARGCAITIQRDAFLAALGNSIIQGGNNNVSSKTGEVFNFYRVAYKEENFTIPGATPAEVESLNKLMQKLHDKVKAYFKPRSRRKEEDEQKIVSLLNDIAFLFKGAEYHYEQEIRLVIEGIGLPKTIDVDALPPKVYINLVSIRPMIHKITLGPKVGRADEWAAAFYYSLDEEGFNPEINMSHLPFK